MPAYNETESLDYFLPEVLEFCKEKGYLLIVVDDGSKDETIEVCNKHKGENTFFTILSHKLNRGYGDAIKTGILHSKTDYVITIDSDGQHRLSDVEMLFSKIKETNADMIVGSRKNEKKSYYRNFGKYIIRSFAKFLLPMDIRDINSGMKMYNAELAKGYIELCPSGMSYSDTILLVFINFKHLVLEFPIEINKRVYGTSTISAKTAIETVTEILNMLILFNPMKLFMRLSIVILIISLIWGLPILFDNRGLSVGTLLGLITSIIVFLLGLIVEQISQIRKSKFYNR